MRRLRDARVVADDWKILLWGLSMITPQDFGSVRHKYVIKKGQSVNLLYDEDFDSK